VEGPRTQEARGSERYDHQHVPINQFVWRNLSQVVVTDAARSMQYLVIYDLVPTNVRLYNIHLMATDSCSECGATDTLKHLLPERGASADLGIYTSALLAYFSSNDNSTCLESVSIVPPSKFGSAQNTKLSYGSFRTWYLLVKFLDLYQHSYLDFTRRTRWRGSQCRTQLTTFGNYIDTF